LAIEIGFAGEIISGRRLALLIGVETSLAKSRPALFEDREMPVDARARKLAAADETSLRRKAALRRVMAKGKAPKENRGRRVEPALLDRRVGREVAHGAPIAKARRIFARTPPERIVPSFVPRRTASVRTRCALCAAGERLNTH
jgi:hypothetical protein